MAQTLPCQTSRLGLRQLRSTLAVKASSQRIAARLVGVGNAVGVVPEGAGQEVAAEVEAEGRVEQVLDLLVRLVLRDLRVEVDGDHVRDADAEAPCELAHEHLGHQDPQSLSGAAELHDVGAEVVGLDDPGQRTALTQRRDVAGGGDAGITTPPPRGRRGRNRQRRTRRSGDGCRVRAPSVRSGPRRDAGRIEKLYFQRARVPSSCGMNRQPRRRRRNGPVSIVIPTLLPGAYET